MLAILDPRRFVARSYGTNGEFLREGLASSSREAIQRAIMGLGAGVEVGRVEVEKLDGEEKELSPESREELIQELGNMKFFLTNLAADLNKRVESMKDRVNKLQSLIEQA